MGLDDLRALVNRTSSKTTVPSIAYNLVSIFQTTVISMVEDSTHFLGRPIPSNYLKIVGLIGGSLVGALNGLILGWRIPNDLGWNYSAESLMVGVTIGLILGAIAGWRIGIAIWLIPLAIVNVAHIGAIIGGTIGIIASVAKFSTSFDGLMFGAIVGAIEGLLLHPRVLNTIEKQLGGPLVREIIRTSLGLVIGGLVGATVGYFLNEAINQGVITSEISTLNSIFFGLVFGASLSVFTATLFLYVLLSIFAERWIGYFSSPFMSVFRMVKNRRVKV